MSSCAALFLYDSLRRAKFPLPPPGGPGVLKWYACGPTVYDVAHVGHARTYVTLDIARRVIGHMSGRPVQYAMGVTDIDDKIVGRAKEQGITPPALAARYEAEFMADLDALGCLPPTALLRVSEHIPEILAYISRILAVGAGYVVEEEGRGASVYLSLSSLGRHYGKLAPPHVAAGEGSSSGGGEGEEWRTSPSSTRGKRDPRDFALWKGLSPREAMGEGVEGATAAAAVQGGWAWDSPWGLGRPGWHIECTAMTHTLFGQSLDIHSGGVDLAFPHHCNEHAQADAWVGGDARESGYQWVQTWMHTGHVHVNGAKMSKSLKNFTAVGGVLRGEGGVKEALQTSGLKGPLALPNAFRLWCLAHHYRDTLTFSPARLGDGGVVGRKLGDFLAATRAIAAKSGGRGVTTTTTSTTPLSHSPNPAKWSPQEKDHYAAWGDTVGVVRGALLDDLDTPRALKALSDAAARGMASISSGRVGGVECVGRELESWLGVFGLSLGGVEEGTTHPGNTNPSAATAGGGGREERAIDALVAQRESLRALAASVRKESKGLDGDQQGSKALINKALGTILQQCDTVRDVTLPELGWSVADRVKGGPLVTRKG